jgi:hypothetical protein
VLHNLGEELHDSHILEKKTGYCFMDWRGIDKLFGLQSKISINELIA